MSDKLICTTQDLLEMLDNLLQNRQGQWWDEFFSDRDKECPFFVEWPDENLVAHFDSGELHPGRVLWTMLMKPLPNKAMNADK